ncbi:hypothetical protein KFE25_006023 [Diacronema lutheri]|uniref:OTU domain-containing protein n=2 Tax=Diacronema lutheri TaxID=2081491 RepID=A0A8J6CJ58_DIALT|nr:hypothetical protein KFE25_006023 [Diacronema lutheri]
MLRTFRRKEVRVPGKGNCCPISISAAFAADGVTVSPSDVRIKMIEGIKMYKGETIAGQIWANTILNEERDGKNSRKRKRFKQTDWCANMGKRKVSGLVNEYCDRKLKPTEWCGESDITMVAITLGVKIHIYMRTAKDGSCWALTLGTDEQRRAFGLQSLADGHLTLWLAFDGGHYAPLLHVDVLDRGFPDVTSDPSREVESGKLGQPYLNPFTTAASARRGGAQAADAMINPHNG